MSQSQRLTYRMYAGPTMRTLAEKLIELGQPLPIPGMCVGWGAVDESENIRGLIVVQSMPVIEPLKVDPEFRDGLVALKLIRRAQHWLDEHKVRRVWTHTDNPTMKQILSGLQMRELSQSLWEYQREEEVTPCVVAAAPVPIVERH